MKIYLLGYSGRTPDDIKRIVGGGVLLDIRLSPKSRKPGFSKKKLEEAFGDHYEWLYEFGNENYQGGDVKLYAPEQGLEIIKELSKLGIESAYLMCICKNGNTCHRRQVGDLLRQHGYKVEEYQD